MGTPGEYATGLKQFQFPNQSVGREEISHPEAKGPARWTAGPWLKTQYIHDKPNVLLEGLRGKL